MEYTLSDRTELRFKFNDPKVVMFVSKHFKKREYSELHCTKTIYFNTPQAEIDNTIKIKARKYTENPEVSEYLNLQEEYFLEIKSEKRKSDVSKTREKPTLLENIIDHVSETFKEYGDVRPVMMSTYLRNHYVNDDESVRITVDSNNTFYRVDQKYAVSKIMTEDFKRLEIKFTGEKDNFIDTLIKNFDLDEVQSKNNVVLTLLSDVKT